jgi:hypothetical protein
MVNVQPQIKKVRHRRRLPARTVFASVAERTPTRHDAEEVLRGD